MGIKHRTDTMLSILSTTKNLYVDLNLKSKELFENFYQKKLDSVSGKAELLLSAQSTHVAITKLKDRVAELEVSDDYLAAYNTLKEAMYNFERATFFLTEGIRTLLPRFLNKAGEFAQEGIRLSEKTIEFHARASIRKKESSKIKVCPECRGKWRRVVDNWQIIGGCESCGYSEVEEELEPRPSGIRDNWDGVIDNVERILEAKVSKQGWTF